MSSPKKNSSRPLESPASPLTVEQPTSLSSESPHELECRIQRALQSHPDLKFARLIVHQCPQGICLEGLLESNDQQIDLCELVNEIAGVKTINRVVTQSTINIPR